MADATTPAAGAADAANAGGGQAPTLQTTAPAAGTPAATTPPADGQGGNDENKFRRLFEAAEAKRVSSEARLAQLEQAENARKEADLTEAQKAQKRADEAEAKVKALESENLKRRIAAEMSLSPETLEFLQGEDEAGLRASATKLAGLVVRAPLQAGTQTAPPGQQNPTADERIAAAEKAGNHALAITLKRERAGIGRVSV